MSEILKAEHLNKYFHEPEDFYVLKDVSVSVNKGEFVSLIGKSGSGKSTLLYLLSTLDTDYEGTIIINQSTELKALHKFKLQDYLHKCNLLLQSTRAIRHLLIQAP